jgi:hypothetical protein
MAYTASLSGFSLAGTAVKAIGNISMSYNRSPVEVTPIGSWNSYFIPGVASTTISMDVYFSHADHSALKAAILNPLTNIAAQPQAFVLTLGGAIASGAVVPETISGFCYIVGWDVVASSGDVVRAQFQLVVQGYVTTAVGATTDLADYGTGETAPASP